MHCDIFTFAHSSRDGENTVIKHYVAKSKYEATERFVSDYREVDFYNISIAEVEGADGFNIILKQPGTRSAPIENKVYSIKCCCCQFNITVYNGQESVVCTHCRTINDVNLQLSLHSGGNNNG